YVHIHTDIKYESAEVTTLTVNEVEIDIEEVTTFADDCGNLVVMFDIATVKDIVIADGSDSADFVLNCNEGMYIGEDSVPVIRTPKNR
ncbi:hypothetical protein ACFLV5_05945, partial [Chloroflexota bacterium]